jgi:NADH-quinone oxidoreductase subunit A
LFAHSFVDAFGASLRRGSLRFARGERDAQSTSGKRMVALYLPVFLLIAVALGLALFIFTATSIAGPKNMTPEKATPYESGSESSGANHIKLSIKFYLTAILFVVFDIEAVFLYPWASLFRDLGWFGFGEMLSFLVVLTITLVYAWRKGALEWEK